VHFWEGIFMMKSPNMKTIANALERVSASQFYYKTLVKKASCGILLATKEGLILDLNTEGEELLSCSQEQAVGKDFIEFIVPSDRAYATAQIQILLRQGAIDFGGIRIQPNAAKKARLVEFSGAKVKIENEDLLMIIANDITELSQSRTQAILNDRLASMAILAGGIAHAVNNPNSWVLANLIFLRDHLNVFEKSINSLDRLMQEPEADEKKQRLNDWLMNFKQLQFVHEYSDIVNESIEGSERIREAMQDFKEFFNVDEVDQGSVVDIHDVLNVVIDIVLPGFKNKTCLEKDYSQPIPKIRGSIGKLNQLFSNLIIHAVKNITTSNTKNNKIHITTNQDGQFIRIDVGSTGSNILSESLPRNFDPFFTTSLEGQDPDLGLTMCHEIVHGLGGKISVVSNPGEETVFSVYLPIQEEPLEVVPSVIRRHILIVDDEPTILKFLQRMLEDHHDVTLALGGRVALEQLAQQNGKFDTILVDLVMPDIDGVELYHRITEDYPGLEEHIIFITGGAYTPTLKQFLTTVPNNPCLEKPFHLQELLQAIEERTVGREKQ